MRPLLFLLAGLTVAGFRVPPQTDPPSVHIRLNLLGYRTDDAKSAVVFSGAPIADDFRVVDVESGSPVYEDVLAPSTAAPWPPFSHYYVADFTALRRPGRFVLRVGAVESPAFTVGPEAYADAHEDLLGFMRQQRCGYNPFFERMCHRRDGLAFFGPVPDSSFVDVTGGWHDAGDQLKYLITASNATARMLLAWDLAGGRFGDRVDERGDPRSNGLADVLDEAAWGVDWLRRLAAVPGAIVHQVADDRDHRGWKYPFEDNADYGWGPDSYRPAYFATGRPQGLGEYPSEATGIGNLAGRTAAALAMAARIWRDDVGDTTAAARALRTAEAIFGLGRRNEGYQQGNSYGAPYRYTERTWADDMEWGAAELYRTTGDRRYLDDAVRYARLAGADTWMRHDSTGHYEYYPFVNVGHYALHPFVDPAMQDSLAAWYRDGIKRTVERARTNPWGIGVPFLWCSNNLVSGLITQILLYEAMTGDLRYHDHMLRHRDWLLGRNPWGTSMFTGLPRDGERPVDVHTSTWALTRVDVPGGLVDGPISALTWKGLRGITLNEPDEFADLQPPHVVYHDDIGDYATNEPTMDGTAGAVPWMAWFARGSNR